MREIKFRAWDKTKRKMRYSDNAPLGLGQFFQEGVDVELMQYTGLKDKNAKEIYEGDIVRYSRYKIQNPEIYEIRWSEYNVGFDLARDDDNWLKQIDGYSYCSGLNQAGNTIEVIGNIYNNPELKAELEA